MDLSTTYLGMELASPLMPGASPLVDDLDTVRRLEDAGAPALVMRSLFEEQLSLETMAAVEQLDSHGDTFAEALSYFPGVDRFVLGPDEYLEQIGRIKQAVQVPVIASLNGDSLGGWLDFATQIQQAGADALELNMYLLATDPDRPAQELEREMVEMVETLRGRIEIPIAVKLSPFYTALAHFARRLTTAGADGLVLFNRFYQPDIDVEELEVVRALHLSDSRDLLLRLRWLAILSGRVEVSLAVSGGVHTEVDALKAVMTGAQAVQMVSALLKNGPDHLRRVQREMAEWLEQHEYESLRQAQGSLNLSHCPNPRALERANYMEILQSWES